jgi:hypothetical protein
MMGNEICLCARLTRLRLTPPVPLRRQLYIPMSVAAAILYRAFLGINEVPAKTEDDLERRIDEAAHTVSVAIRVYRMDLADPVEIAKATLVEGLFTNGGRRLQFRDGRPPIESLGVNRIDLDQALARRAHIVPQNRPEALIPAKFTRPKL